MKKNKLNKKKVYITLGIILLIITISLSYGRYAYNGIKDFYLASKNFYFNSDKLKWQLKFNRRELLWIC